MKIIYGGITERGIKREKNEDSVRMLSNRGYGLFLVADGMGGHANGELASRRVAQDVKTWWEEKILSEGNIHFEDCVDSLKQLLQDTNTSIFRDLNQNQICGSTVVLLFIMESQYAILSSGDSRGYTLRNIEDTANIHLIQLTGDDIWDNLESTKKAFTVEEIGRHKNSGKLVHVIGAESETTVQLVI